MSSISSSFLLLLLASALPFLANSRVYNAQGNPSWPDNEIWTDELSAMLSSDAALHGPFADAYYTDQCEGLGSDAYAISKAGSGICMHAHACKHEFCRSQFPEDLPPYIVEAKEPADIQKALSFGKNHNIPVTVKTTGHSYHGASTAKDSLLIWMQNYPKNGTILDNYTSCDGNTTYHAVISVNGGETWNDVIEAVGPDYHVVSGAARTVSAAGGWLMGSGLSFSSREYGLGIDNAVQFEVVLADGSLVTANACANTDLFWALRGGGGGTFGVVTNVLYKLHPLTPIVSTNWFVGGFEQAPLESIEAALSEWLKFWIEVSPDLDDRFGGYFNAVGAHLAFAGTREEANEAFLNRFQEWYNTVLLPKAGFIPGVFGAASPFDVTSVVDSWYTYKGGAAAYNNPDSTDATGDSYLGAETISARLMPESVVREQPNEVFDLLYKIILSDGFGGLGPVNYFLGGKVNQVADDATSVHPAMRNAIWNIFTQTPEANAAVKELLPNNVTGACFNHHSPVEPNWRDALWGSQYERLVELKDQYDPDKIFNCWHCIGYTGDENPGLGNGTTGIDDPVIEEGEDEMDSDDEDDTSAGSAIFGTVAIMVAISLTTISF